MTVYECKESVVISPSQYYAKAGEKIFLKDNFFLHLDLDGSILYKDDGFKKDVLEIKVSHNFEKGFNLLLKNYKKPFIENDLKKILKITRKSPIIIGGCGRSGTTLLLSVLGSHKNIFAIPEETHAFYPKPYKLARILRYVDKTDKRWCEKTPKNVMCYKEILKIFSNNVKIINMIRNGKDVITSIHPNGKNKYWVDKERWIEDNSQFLDHENILTIKFENLVHNTEVTLKKICSHIEEEYDSSMLDYHLNTTVKKNIAWYENATPIGQFNRRKIKNKEDYKKIKEFMNDEAAVGLMKKMGYID